MTQAQKKTNEKAKTIYGRITVCNKAGCWEKSFVGGFLWFNTDDQSTHTVKVEEREEPREITKK